MATAGSRNPSPEELEARGCLGCPIRTATQLGLDPCPFVHRHRRRGEVVYQQGQPAAFVWFIRRGSLVLTRGVGGPKARASARAVVSDGAFMGLEALVSQTYLDTARATSDVALCSVPTDSLDHWLGPKTAPARAALEQVLKTTCHEAPRGAGADGSAVRRVARWVLSESDKSEAPEVPRSVTASLLGMTPETLSRALARLAKLGAIHLTRRTLRVRDMRTLETAAGGENGAA